MGDLYLNFKFDNFGDGYIALRDIQYIGNDHGFVSYYEVLNILKRIGFSGASKPGVMWEPIKNIENKEEYLDIGWDRAQDINYECLTNYETCKDIWILSFKDPKRRLSKGE